METLPIFGALRPGDDRPRAAIAALRAWERGELPMTACRTAAFAAHAAARDATEAGAPAAVAAARAAGQACAVAHMFDHSPHAATYAAKAVGFHDGGKAARNAERAWQWENLAPELRSIGFPKGFRWLHDATVVLQQVAGTQHLGAGIDAFLVRTRSSTQQARPEPGRAHTSRIGGVGGGDVCCPGDALCGFAKFGGNHP